MKSTFVLLMLCAGCYPSHECRTLAEKSIQCASQLNSCLDKMMNKEVVVQCSDDGALWFNHCDIHEYKFARVQVSRNWTSERFPFEWGMSP